MGSIALAVASAIAEQTGPAESEFEENLRRNSVSQSCTDLDGNKAGFDVHSSRLLPSFFANSGSSFWHAWGRVSLQGRICRTLWYVHDL